MMKVTQKGTLEIAEHEGIVLGPYLCSANVWTYGVGHTAAAGGLDPNKMAKVDTRGWSKERVEQELLAALKVFDEDLTKYEARVASQIKVPLKPHQHDVLVSWDLNTGGVTWRSASGQPAQLVQQIRNGDMSGSGLMGWLRPPELRKRREAELNLFRTGNYDANGDSIPVYDALGNGKIRHRMTISGAQLAALMAKTGATHKPATRIRPELTFSEIVAAFFAWITGGKAHAH